jgi:predicted GTPase
MNVARPEPILLWVGPTQVGKSSAIKLITEDENIVCGRFGIGSSTTNNIKVHYERRPKLGRSYLHMDTIGLGDNRLTVNDDEIMKQIEIEILKKSDAMNITEVPALIAVDSFQADAYRLP